MPLNLKPCPYRLALWRARVLQELSDHLDSDQSIGTDGDLDDEVRYFLKSRVTEQYWCDLWEAELKGKENPRAGKDVSGGEWREITRIEARSKISHAGPFLQEVLKAGRDAGWRRAALRSELLCRAHKASLKLGTLRLQISAWDRLVSSILEEFYDRLTRGGQAGDAARLERLHDMLCALGQPNEAWQALPRRMVENVKGRLEERSGPSTPLAENPFRPRRNYLDHFDPTFGVQGEQADNTQNENGPRISSSSIRLSRMLTSKYQQVRRLRDLTIWSRAAESVTVPCFQRLAREATAWTERLAQIHHNPLLGQHNLDHVERLLHLINGWAVAGSWVDTLSPTEHAYLFLAAIVHDWGMLSPEGKEEEVPEDTCERAKYIRRTHTNRLPEIVDAKLVAGRQYLGGTQPLGDLFEGVANLGASHRHWPQTEDFRILTDKAADNLPGMTKERAAGIAALVAVADLLDESVVRTDTPELFQRSDADVTNKAHWLRHNMTRDTPRWLDGQWLVRLQVPGGVNEEGLEEAIIPAIRAVKNQYRLAGLYSDALAGIGVDFRKKEGFRFLPESDLDIAKIESAFTEWRRDPQIDSDIPGTIIGTVFPEARGDLNDCPQGVVEALDDLDIEDIWSE